MFSPEQIADLEEGHAEARRKCEDLKERFVARRFEKERAGEFATHGFARRLGTLIRCIDRVFEVLPPDLKGVPPRDDEIDATVNIQAFVFNTFGCCDNLARIWVEERGVTQKDGQVLPPTWVGLGPKFARVNESFSSDFRTFLEGMSDWFLHLKDFRDALAHRIPLYIPPFMIDPANADAYRTLDAEAYRALISRDIDRYRALTAERDALAFFRPLMTHSFSDGAKMVIIHAQLLADFNTVDAIGREMLIELDR